MLVNAKLIYITLRCICIMYLLPIGYIAVLLTYREWFQGQSQIWKLVFVRSSEITDKLWIGAVVWFIFAIVMISYFGLDRLSWKLKLEDNIPENDTMVIRTLQRACNRLGISKMEINRNVRVTMPLVYGYFHPQVILPEIDYTEEDLEFIFYHELSHYKNKDLIYKILAVIVMVVHFFNPFAYLLLRWVNLWSECMADISAIEASGNRRNAKLYFDNISKLVPDGKKTENESAFVSTLCKNEKMIVRRVDFMGKYLRMKSTGKVVTGALTAFFVMLSATTAYASGKTIADLHSIVYQKSESRMDVAVDSSSITKDAVTTDDGELFFVTEDELNQDGMEVIVPPDDGIATITEGQYYPIDWICNPNTRHVGAEHYVKAGQTISVSVTVTPTDKDYWVGVFIPGKAWYKSAKGSTGHNFIISETGYYRVFVQNNYKDGTTLKAVGQYIYGN